MGFPVLVAAPQFEDFALFRRNNDVEGSGYCPLKFEPDSHSFTCGTMSKRSTYMRKGLSEFARWETG